MSSTMEKALYTAGAIVAPFVAFAVFLFGRQLYLALKLRSYHLPPGPKGTFILGHVNRIPSYQAAVAYTDWGKTYGDGSLFSMHILGKPVVVINTVSAAEAILDKNGSATSDRPTFWFSKIQGYNHTLSFMPFGNRMLLHRKIVQRHLAKSALKPYNALQVNETRLLIPRLVAGTPEKMERNIRRAATAIILNIAFGQSIESDDDPYIEIAEQASRGLASGRAGGTTLLDVSPLFRFLPDCLAPDGLLWARKHKTACERIHTVPCEAVQRQMADGTAKPSLLKSFLEDIEDRGENKNGWGVRDAQGAAVTMYAAGQDTTTSSIVTFIVAMLNYPEVQRKAQEEMARVVGPDRLPEFEDRENLPYLEHVLWETFRFFPATPLGLSHKSVKDTVYKDYTFPTGTVFIPNAFAMTRDPLLYSEPTEFIPERYAAGEPAPIGQWGFGRRICPGQHLASSTIWITMATILATVSIVPRKDEAGNEIPPTTKWASGFAHRFTPPDCDFVYQSKRAEQLLMGDD